eukprot:TRINITY_DN3029_c0_g1_i1.p2 TRINITY_DN3029_c0_g1~~TRINITY_DN3029_c0_g1_i1.p2  ORF type:complete len:124 (+),score=31.86 TRINITY_DN3029_c0_g1_i1:1-372(+)
MSCACRFMPHQNSNTSAASTIIWFRNAMKATGKEFLSNEEQLVLIERYFSEQLKISSSARGVLASVAHDSLRRVALQYEQSSIDMPDLTEQRNVAKLLEWDVTQPIEAIKTKAFSKKDRELKK